MIKVKISFIDYFYVPKFIKIDNNPNSLKGLLDTPTPSKKSSVTPYVEDKQLSCAGQELTFIPSSWGELYGDQIHYLDLSYNSLTFDFFFPLNF